MDATSGDHEADAAGRRVVSDREEGLSLGSVVFFPRDRTQSVLPRKIISVTTFLRSLVLCTGLLLILPPGWCCATPRMAGQTPVKPACCPHCNAKERAPATPSSVPFGPKSSPKACCVAGIILIPPTVEQNNPVPTIAAAHFASAVARSGDSGTVADTAAVWPLAVPLHVLHCLWLC